MSEIVLRSSARILFDSVVGLKVRPRFCRAEGPSGLHRSPQRGETVEFSEYKPYTPGVEPRFLDWKLYARTDRLFVKSFCDERASRFLMICDDSASMMYPPDGRTKLHLASELALGLAFLAVQRQKDSVGLAPLSQAPRAAADSQSLGAILAGLETILANSADASGASSGIVDLLSKLELRYPTTVIVISDLYDDPGALLKWSLQMRHRGHESWFLHVLSKEEVGLPYESLRNFVDVESGQKLQLDPRAIRAHYSRALHEHIAGLKLLAAHGRYALGILGQDPSVILKRFLSD